MPLRARLPLTHPEAREVSPDLAILAEEGEVVFFNAAGPIFMCRRDDRTGVRTGAVEMVKLGLAGPSAVAEVLGIHRTTLFRDACKFEAAGVEGLRERPRGPKGPHRLTPEVQGEAQRLLDRGESIRSTAQSVGMSERGVRHAIQRGLLVLPSSRRRSKREDAPETLTGPGVRAEQDRAGEAGVAVKRMGERALARVGQIVEAMPSFVAAEAVAGAGVLLALPGLLHEGLLEVGEGVYGKLRNGFFGLRSILLTLAFMALLRIKTPEQLTEHAPGELGLLLGLDRAPEVKTLRRKLLELGAEQKAHEFTRRLTERWVEAEPQELGLLYVDGHVRPYHGRAHVLPEQHVQQRGRSMPGTKDVHVNDRRADPLFFVTAPATESLLAMLDSKLLPEIRRLVGPRRRVTIVFDREGWSPSRFARWKKESFDVLTYRKGEMSRWRDSSFAEVAGRVGGEKVQYRLAGRRVRLSNGLRVREIRRLTNDGHQTAVVTTAEKLPILAVAHRMFSRWRQENFFRYMRHEFALDHLCTYKVERADTERQVPNPERKELQAQLRAARLERGKLLAQYVDLPFGETVRVAKRHMDAEDLDRLIHQREAEIRRLEDRVAVLPKRVPIGEVLEPDQIVQLERERKILVDAIKLTAYRAETALARLVEPLFERYEDEARKFLKTIFRATADLIPDPRARRLTVRFHGLASPRATRALRELCDLVNHSRALYPGTKLRLHFEAP
jgi:hypothetical protein